MLAEEGERPVSADEATIGLATIVVFGVGCQWIGRRLGIPGDFL